MRYSACNPKKGEPMGARPRTLAQTPPIEPFVGTLLEIFRIASNEELRREAALIDDLRLFIADASPLPN